MVKNQVHRAFLHSSTNGFSVLLLLLLRAGIVLLSLGIDCLATFLSPSLPWFFMGANYLEAWQRGNFWLAFANSSLVVVAVTFLQAIFSALAGYVLARLNFHGRGVILLLILTTLIIPFQVLVVPIFWGLKWGYLINTYWALFLPTAANGYNIFFAATIIFNDSCRSRRSCCFR